MDVAGASTGEGTGLVRERNSKKDKLEQLGMTNNGQADGVW